MSSEAGDMIDEAAEKPELNRKNSAISENSSEGYFPNTLPIKQLFL